MIHFPKLKPSKQDLKDPIYFYSEKLSQKVHQAAQDLSDPSLFQLKIIDYGFARHFEANQEV